MAKLCADYVVAGGGPAGLTVARLLSLKGKKAVVVDPELKDAKRLELLSPVSLNLIAALNLTSVLDDSAISRPCLGIRRRWASAEPEHVYFAHQRTGYVVDRKRFDKRLRAAAIAAGVGFVKARIASVEAGGLICLVGDRKSCEMFTFAGTIIDATGRAAAVARRKGATVTICDKINAELIDETSTSGADAPAWLDVQKLDMSSWTYQIQGIAGQSQTWRVLRSGHPSTHAGRRRVDASARIMSKMAGENWIAVGDAASAFDPITSQGLFNALSSALVAAGALTSREGLTIEAAQLYSDAVTATFVRSEAERSRIY